MSPAPPPLPGVFAALAPILDSYGYLAVGGLLFLEDFGIPAPGETVLIAAAVYAGAGRLNLTLVVLIGLIAAITGDNVGYAIGRFGGRRLVEKGGPYIGLTPARLGSAERFFARHGGKIIVVARFVEGLRQANGIIAGISGMPWLRFLAFNVTGALLWVGTWTALGDLAGAHIGQIYDTLRRYELALLIGLALVLAAAAYRHRRRSRHHATALDSDTGSGDSAGSGSADSDGGSAAGPDGSDAVAPSPANRTRDVWLEPCVPDGSGSRVLLALPPTGPTVAGLVIAVCTLAVLWAGVSSGTLLAALDPVADAWLVPIRPAWLVTVAGTVSDVGQPAVMIGVVVVVLAARTWRAPSWTPVAITAGSLALLGLLDNGVKAIAARPRPPLAGQAMAVHGFSFPSGHALWSAGTMLLVVVLVAPRHRLAVAAGAALVAVLVAASRVVLAVHYPSDVLAGWALAVIADGIVLLVATRLARCDPSRATLHTAGSVPTGPKRNGQTWGDSPPSGRDKRCP